MSKDQQASSSAIHSFQRCPASSDGPASWIAHIYTRTTDRKQEPVATILLVEKDGDKVDAIAGEICDVFDRLFKANQQ